jgi:5-methylcytosine-specific restriction endonuclease McrA
MIRWILALDTAGTPRNWVSAETAVGYYARSLVVYGIGKRQLVFRGGRQRNGERSVIRVDNIIAVRGVDHASAMYQGVPRLSNTKLFARDRRLCAYCGERFRTSALSREHVVPVSRGGRDVWTNVVTACRDCNARKSDRTPEESGMRLLYLPYVPSRWEDFILANRDIRADQMEYLLAKVPAESRLRN